MTNLEIIKYLALNNPDRLAEFLDDIYCLAWNCGAYAQRNIDKNKYSPMEMEFSEEKWLEQEANTDFFFDCDLEEWSKSTHQNPNLTITATYDNLAVTFPVKDADHMWNNNNEYDYEINKEN